MALIGKIRKNSWLLIVLIGIGLAGFIVMDMTSGQQSVFGSSRTIVGRIEGEKLDWNRFARIDQIQYEVLYRNSGAEPFSRRNALWNYFIEDVLVHQESEKLGLGVSKEELMDLQFGTNLSPVISQRFMDPSTRQVNRQQLDEFKRLIESNELSGLYRSYWAHQEKEVLKDRLQSKINTLVTKAMYTPTWMAQIGHADRNVRVDFKYVKVPFDELDNTEVSLSDEDFETYIEENEAQYRQDEETRKVDFLTFNVVATAEDSSAIQESLAILAEEFKTTDNDTSFVERNLGTFDGAYLKKEALSPLVSDTLSNLAVGEVYGPYIEGNTYKLAKVLNRKTIPDSVKSRHILLPLNDATQFTAVASRIDSLKNLLETGASSWDSLALAFGTDATRTKGGDLGWAGPGTMVKPFNDLIFFDAEVGELNTVITQFGMHLVEVTDRKYETNESGVQVAYISKNIVPSEKTQNTMYQKALTFVGTNNTLEKLTAAVDADPTLSLETSPALKENDYVIGTLPASQESRDIILWAFKNDVGDVSPSIYTYQDPVDYYASKYVIAGLTKVIDEGLPAVEDVRAEIEPLVINKKKGELLKQQMAGKDLNSLASQYSVSVDTVKSINFVAQFVPNVGNEPELVSSAFKLDLNQTSEPVIGNTGVYMIELINKTPATAANNIPALRKQISSAYQSQVNARLFQTLKDNANIVDRRSTFY